MKLPRLSISASLLFRDNLCTARLLQLLIGSSVERKRLCARMLPQSAADALLYRRITECVTVVDGGWINLPVDEDLLRYKLNPLNLNVSA